MRGHQKKWANDVILIMSSEMRGRQQYNHSCQHGKYGYWNQIATVTGDFALVLSEFSALSRTAAPNARPICRFDKCQVAHMSFAHSSIHKQQ